MPFPKGQSGNPGGKRKPVGLSRTVRASEGLKTWARLLRLRDDLVIERKVIKGPEGEEVEVDVVPSAKTYSDVCFRLLAYCWGTPEKADFDGKQAELERRVEELEERLKEATGRPYRNGNGLRATY